MRLLSPLVEKLTVQRHSPFSRDANRSYARVSVRENSNKNVDDGNQGEKSIPMTVVDDFSRFSNFPKFSQFLEFPNFPHFSNF